MLLAICFLKYIEVDSWMLCCKFDLLPVGVENHSGSIHI